MKRKIIVNLDTWANKKIRKPLVLLGARQVGKSYVLKEFAERCFGNSHVFNFEKDKKIHIFFEIEKDPKKIIKLLSDYTGKIINLKKDLIIFDEIQACPEALTALKYFAEDAAESFICAAGSLLGLQLSQSSFPVGKVDLEYLHPMDFEEYVDALGLAPIFQSYMKAPNDTNHSLIWKVYIDYLIVGGMPEAVRYYSENKSSDVGDKLQSEVFEQISNIHEQILTGYRADMAKHSGDENSMVLDRVFINCAEKIGQDQSEKFIFKNVFPGKRSYEDFFGPIQWLQKAGLIYQIHILDSIKVPLSVQKKESQFKLFVFDVGLMNHLAGTSFSQILGYDFSHKGFISEAFILQEMIALKIKSNLIYSYKHSMTEIEFIFDYEGDILPIEVKAGLNLKSKSLSTYLLRHNPKKALRFSQRTLNLQSTKEMKVRQDWPLFLIQESLRKKKAIPK